MKRLFTLLAIVLLFCGGTRIQGFKKRPVLIDPEERLLISIDSLCAATDKLQSLSIITKK